MQYLKEDVKERIQAAALKEFREKGFNDASMRSIAQNAGVAIGNVYRYFKSKEDLYDSMIGPVYDRLVNFVQNISRIDRSFNDPIGSINSIRDKILEIFQESNTELLILLEKSDGTKYHYIKENLVVMVEGILKKTIVSEVVYNNVKKEDEFIAYVLSTSLMEGVCSILREKFDGTRTKLLIDQLIDIMFCNMRI